MIRVRLEKGSAEIIDRIKRAKRSGGINWGSPIVVLARYGDKELWQERGSGLYSRMGGNYWVPGGLYLIEEAEKHHSMFRGKVTKLQEGGRISGKTFREHADRIDAFFGAKIAHLLNVRQTVIVYDKEK
jgi:hypothetical protein